MRELRLAAFELFLNPLHYKEELELEGDTQTLSSAGCDMPALPLADFTFKMKTLPGPTWESMNEIQ